MSQAKHINLVSEQDYLEGEKVSETRHEYVNGEVFAMTGASKHHDIITTNIIALFKAHLKGSQCITYGDAVKIKTANGKYRYPDCMVVCEEQNDDPYITSTPKLIVEVISPSTRREDEQIKRLEYINMPSVEEYVLVEQSNVKVMVLSRAQQWQPTFYYEGDDITFESIDLTLPVMELYEQVAQHLTKAE